MEGGLKYYSQLLLKTNDKFKSVSCQLDSCIKLLNDQRHQNLILRRQYHTLLQTTNSNSLYSPSFHRTNAIPLSASNETTSRLITQEHIGCSVSKYMASKKNYITYTAKVSASNDNDTHSSFRIPLSKISSTQPDSIEDKLGITFKGMRNMPTSNYKKQLNLTIKLFDKLFSFIKSNEIVCKFCREVISRNKIYQNHMNSFHGMTDTNDLCATMFTNLVMVKLQAATLPLFYSSSSIEKRNNEKSKMSIKRVADSSNHDNDLLETNIMSQYKNDSDNVHSFPAMAENKSKHNDGRQKHNNIREYRALIVLNQDTSITDSSTPGNKNVFLGIGNNARKIQNIDTLLIGLNSRKEKHTNINNDASSNVQENMKYVYLKTNDHVCIQCDNSFFEEKHLNNHVNEVHLNVKDHHCNECDKIFSKKQFLDRHVNDIHLKIKAFQCSECDKAFSQKTTLKTHVKQVHSRIKDYECEQCDYASSEKGSLTSM